MCGLMAAAATRNARLMALLHGFGLNSAKLADQQPKAVMATLRAEYYRLAKERHPDRVPEEQKAEASERFVQLQNDFSEAVKLLEAGIQPWRLPPMGGMQPGPGRKMYAPPSYGGYGYGQGHNFQHLEPQEFDTKTRIKGHVVVWSSLFVFFCFFREFLVWSAGSTGAWNPPKELSLLKIRRYRDDWVEEKDTKKKEEEEAAKAALREKQKKAAFQAKKTDRSVGDFYQKRGISNVRRKTEPRGLGPSL